MQVNKINNQNFTSHPITTKEIAQIKDAFKFKKVFLYDVNTTHGLMDQAIRIRKNGIRDGFPIQGADDIIPALKKIKRMLKGRLPKIETVDAHKFTDPEIGLFKNISDIHSEKGTHGAKKIKETIFAKPRYIIEVEPTKEFVPEVYEIRNAMMHNDVIRIEKNEIDVLKYGDGKTGIIFDNKKGLKFFENLKKAGAQIALVYGVAEEHGVKAAVNACKRFKITPIIIEDAVKDAGQKVLKDINDPVYGDVATITTAKLGEIFSHIG